jgi:UDP-N-acetylglucosamine 4,6-dehydratase
VASEHRFQAATEDFADMRGLSLLVTGGTGSFGKYFVKRVLDALEPKRLVVFSRDELKQSDMAEALSPRKYSALRYFLGDVRDRDRLEMALRGIDVVVHAAALKQVPAAEYNPFECIHTNILGAENLVRASIAANVKKVVALSTDKAVNPINLYGASKLAADKIFVAANNLSGESGPKFSVVRYGNVVGSRGSVVPYFRKLIAEGAAALPITHPDMTRFWITLPQGVDFVLNAIRIMQGGEIFVPKIPSMSVAGVAKALAPELPLATIGIRPGEKLHETLITEDDARSTFDLGDRYVITPSIRFAKLGEYPDCARVSPDFRYTSDKNPDRLTIEEFQKLLFGQKQ